VEEYTTKSSSTPILNFLTRIVKIRNTLIFNGKIFILGPISTPFSGIFAAYQWALKLKKKFVEFNGEVETLGANISAPLNFSGTI